MTNNGTVIALDGENALIKVKRISACDACEGKAACEGSLVGECAKSTEVTFLARNEAGAKVGDRVEFCSSTAMTLGIAVAVFILPLVVGFSSYFIAEKLCTGSVFAPYGVSLAFFALSFVCLFFGIDRYLKGKIKVRVTKILDENEKE